MRSVIFLQLSFASLSFDDKVRITHKEQPMPDLRIHTLSCPVKGCGGGAFLRHLGSQLCENVA